MTTPKVNTIKRGGSRYYVEPETGRKHPGVTSVLNMLPKEFLKFWSAKVVAEYAVDNLSELVGIAMKDRGAAVDLLKGAPNRFTRGAADVGTEAHDLFEAIAKGDRPRRVHNDLKPYVDNFLEFIDECDPEFIFLEETVWSDDHGYAGSFDALGVLHGEGAGNLKGKTVFFDWKTTRSGVHEEVALQLSAYSRATHVIRPDGSRVPLPKTEGAAVLLVRPEGWQLVPVETGEVDLGGGQAVDVFDYFLALREVFDWDGVVKKRVLGTPVAAGGEFKGKRTTRITRPKAAAK